MSVTQHSKAFQNFFEKVQTTFIDPDTNNSDEFLEIFNKSLTTLKNSAYGPKNIQDVLERRKTTHFFYNLIVFNLWVFTGIDQNWNQRMEQKAFDKYSVDWEQWLIEFFEEFAKE